MSPMRQFAAARNAFVVLLLGQAISAWMACAEGQAQLLLPLVTALAVGVGAVEVGTETARGHALLVPPPPRRHSSMLPQRLDIPDGYAIDLDRPLPRYAMPIDRDRVVAFDLLQRRGWLASVAYDEESRRPFQGSGDLVRLIIEFRF